MYLVSEVVNSAEVSATVLACARLENQRIERSVEATTVTAANCVSADILMMSVSTLYQPRAEYK